MAKSSQVTSAIAKNLNRDLPYRLGNLTADDVAPVSSQKSGYGSGRLFLLVPEAQSNAMIVRKTA